MQFLLVFHNYHSGLKMHRFELLHVSACDRRTEGQIAAFCHTVRRQGVVRGCSGCRWVVVALCVVQRVLVASTVSTVNTTATVDHVIHATRWTGSVCPVGCVTLTGEALPARHVRTRVYITHTRTHTPTVARSNFGMDVERKWVHNRWGK